MRPLKEVYINPDYTDEDLVSYFKHELLTKREKENWKIEHKDEKPFEFSKDNIFSIDEVHSTFENETWITVPDSIYGYFMTLASSDSSRTYGHFLLVCTCFIVQTSLLIFIYMSIDKEYSFVCSNSSWLQFVAISVFALSLLSPFSDFVKNILIMISTRVAVKKGEHVLSMVYREASPIKNNPFVFILMMLSISMELLTWILVFIIGISFILHAADAGTTVLNAVAIVFIHDIDNILLREMVPKDIFEHQQSMYYHVKFDNINSNREGLRLLSIFKIVYEIFSKYWSLYGPIVMIFVVSLLVVSARSFNQC